LIIKKYVLITIYLAIEVLISSLRLYVDSQTDDSIQSAKTKLDGSEKVVM